MKATISAIPPFLVFVFVLFSVATLSSQAPVSQQDQPEFIKQGQQLMREGKLDDALALYRQTLQTSQDSLPANIAAGSVLDLMGRGEDARKYFAKAIEVADAPEHKAMAQRAIAISYAFEGDCGKAAEYDKLVFDFYGSAKNFYQQGEIADEIARVCLDSADDGRNRYPGDRVAAALDWYKTGHETGLKEPGIEPARKDLWDFRWEHAQARYAVHTGETAEAQKHVAAAKAILDRGTIPQQAQFFPYLVGYIAFYSSDYTAALAEFLKADQNDPFIQCMIARTYEKLSNKEKALEYYRKVSTAIAHNPAAAYAVAFAKKKLSSLTS